MPKKGSVCSNVIGAQMKDWQGTLELLTEEAKEQSTSAEGGRFVLTHPEAVVNKRGYLDKTQVPRLL
jgi:hypothetical protein